MFAHHLHIIAEFSNLRIAACKLFVQFADMFKPVVLFDSAHFISHSIDKKIPAEPKLKAG